MEETGNCDPQSRGKAVHRKRTKDDPAVGISHKVLTELLQICVRT